MTLTKRKALEECRDLWKWLAETGRYWKGSAPVLENKNYWHDCPCCQYVVEHCTGDDDWKADCPTKCPMRQVWRRGDGIQSIFNNSLCEGYVGSPWELWSNEAVKDKRDVKVLKKYAMQIYEGAVKALKELPPPRAGKKKVKK